MSRGTPAPASSYLFSHTGLSPSMVGFSKTVLLRSAPADGGPLPRGARTTVWALPISLAATLEIEFSFFSSPYLDVSVQEVPPAYLWIQYAVHEVCSCGFPHSEISGSKDMCSSPKLIAAYHVFHRLSVPRHPPYALCSFTIPDCRG